MCAKLAFGILDFGVYGSTSAPGARVRESVEEAVLAESLGCSRYWFAEHHDLSCAWASPEIVMALAAHQTTRLRIGAGGFLLDAHNVLQLSNTVTGLSHIFGDRIDVGVARGTAAFNQAALSAQRYQGHLSDSFSRDVVALLRYLRGIPQPTPAELHARTVPVPTGLPRVWVLGTGGSSNATAARLGLPLAHSVFHDHSKPADLLRQYSQAFRRGAHETGPTSLLAVAGVCAETLREAKAAEEQRLIKEVRPNVVGTPESVRMQLEELAEAAGATEVLYLELSATSSARCRAYTMLAEELHLGASLGSLPMAFA